MLVKTSCLSKETQSNDASDICREGEHSTGIMGKQKPPLENNWDDEIPRLQTITYFECLDKTFIAPQEDECVNDVLGHWHQAEGGAIGLETKDGSHFGRLPANG